MSDLPIALSTGPNTRLCTGAIRRLLGESGQSVREYEADGRGGRNLEGDALAGRVVAVLDLTLTELAAELLGIAGGAGPDRLTAAGLRGIPQVIVLGALHTFQLRPEDYDALGREIANKASAARGPTTILISLRDASPVLIRSLTNWVSPSVRVRELDLHVNDPAFAVAMIESLPSE